MEVVIVEITLNVLVHAVENTKQYNIDSIELDSL